MLMPADKVLASLIAEFEKLQITLADAGTDGSGAQAIAGNLKLLHARETGGQAALKAQFAKLDQALTAAAGLLGSDDVLANWRQVKLRAVAESHLPALEALWWEALAAAEAVALVANEKHLPSAIRANLAAILAPWEAEDLLAQMQDDNASMESEPENAPITPQSLGAYLRARFSDDSIDVTHVLPLAGGFGKQTTLFSVTGRVLAGDFVMRRDMGKNSSLANDCHQIVPEFTLIRAVHEHGFPAPDVLWLDTEHELLPGGHFIVMRRSPGQVAGNVFGARMAIPEDLVQVLAGQMAALHNLPPLRELGALTDAIRPELWDMDRAASTERYIRNWYEFYLSQTHIPSPAIASLYGWLFANVPDRPGPSSLLHGDIGFHNFLFHEGKISALLDWEFAHIGDPAEDLGYVRETVGGAMDWEHFMRLYQQAGGGEVDAKTLHFFQVWAHMRNASAANIITSRFGTGQITDLKVTVLPYLHSTHFIRAAQTLIATGP